MTYEKRFGEKLSVRLTRPRCRVDAFTITHAVRPSEILSREQWPKTIVCSSDVDVPPLVKPCALVGKIKYRKSNNGRPKLRRRVFQNHNIKKKKKKALYWERLNVSFVKFQVTMSTVGWKFNTEKVRGLRRSVV